jgi:hypothetical protein
MTQPQVQLVKGTGEPAVGWKVYTYAAGTSVPKPTYTDYGKTGMNTNPVILDARGMGDIWLDGAYKIVLKDENDVLICTQDNVVSYSGIDFTDIDITIDDLNSTDTSAIPTSVDYSLLFSDRGKTVTANASSGNIQVFLPPIANVPNKWMARIKKVDLSSNTVTLVTNLTERIDLMDNYILRSFGDLIEVLCDGSTWHITTLYERNHKIPFTAHTINVTQQHQNKVINANSSTGNCVVNLPVLSSVGDGFTVTIRRNGDSNVNMVSVIPDVLDSISWVYPAPFNLKTSHECVTLLADADNFEWIVINYCNSHPGAVGDLKYSENAFTQPGWLRLDSSFVMGSPAASQGYRGYVYKDLYTYLWNNFPDSAFPVSGGRGASSEDDWNAGKTIQLPLIAGRVVVAQGTGVGLTARNIGDIVGQESISLLDANNGPHIHATAQGRADGFGSNQNFGLLAKYNLPGFANYADSMSLNGSGTPFTNLQPSAVFYAFIKF